MAASPPERSLTRALLLRAAVAGALLGITLLAGATLVLATGAGLVMGATGVVATAGVAFVVGLWAGVPGAEWDDPPLRARALGLGVALAAAGAAATALSILRPLGSTPVGRIFTLFFVIALPAYAVALILPAILEWGERAAESLADGGETEPWAVLGPVAVGLVLGIVGGVLLAGLVLLPDFPTASILLLTSLVPVVALRAPQPIAPVVEENTLYRDATAFGELRVAELVYPGERQPERRLYLDGEEESGELVRSGAPVLAYVSAAERWLADTTAQGAAYLFLGGGAYTLPRRVAERDPSSTITVVELDPEVTRIAYRFFGLRPELGIRVVHGDARAFIARASGPWDAIYLDVYAGHESLPYALTTRDAFLQLRDLLNERGTVAVNLIGTSQGNESLRLWSIVRTFAEVFPAVALYLHHGVDFPDRQNFLLVGSPAPDHTFPPRAGLFDALPRDRWPGWSHTVVFRDLYLPTHHDHGISG